MIAKERNLCARFIASFDHIPFEKDQQNEWYFVDPGRDSVDLFILNEIRKGDVLITQDIGLASLVLPKGVYALSPKGTSYKEETITTMLDFRFLSAKARQRGVYGKGPSPFNKDDRLNFQHSLRRLLSEIEGV